MNNITWIERNIFMFLYLYLNNFWFLFKTLVYIKSNTSNVHNSRFPIGSAVLLNSILYYFYILFGNYSHYGFLVVNRYNVTIHQLRFSHCKLLMFIETCNQNVSLRGKRINKEGIMFVLFVDGDFDFFPKQQYLVP